MGCNGSDPWTPRCSGARVMSRVSRHLSRVSRHMSRVSRHTSWRAWPEKTLSDDLTLWKVAEKWLKTMKIAFFKMSRDFMTSYRMSRDLKSGSIESQDSWLSDHVTFGSRDTTCMTSCDVKSGTSFFISISLIILLLKLFLKMSRDFVTSYRMSRDLK